jgi:hypothetical protein
MFSRHNSWKDTTIFLPLDWITWLPWRWENWLRLETILFPMGNRRAVGSDVVMFQFLHPAWNGLETRTQVFPAMSSRFWCSDVPIPASCVEWTSDEDSGLPRHVSLIITYQMQNRPSFLIFEPSYGASKWSSCPFVVVHFFTQLYPAASAGACELR